MVVSVWPAQPQYPMKPLQNLSLLPQRNKEKNQEQCPVTVNFARAVWKPVWLTSWHMSFRGGRRVVMLGRGHKHRDMHTLLPEESIPSLPCTPASPNTYPCPQVSTSVWSVPKKLTKKRTYKWNVPEGNKICDQIKFCVPCLLKEKWRSNIQWRFSILHIGEHGQAEIICPWARTNPWDRHTEVVSHSSQAPEYEEKTATPNPQQYRCCASLRSTRGIDCSLPNLCTFNRTPSALIHSSRKPHFSSSQSQSLLG